MNFQEYLVKMKNLHQMLLDYLEDTEDCISLEDLIEDRYELVSLLHFIIKISNHHHQNENFISKIEKIIQFFKKDIQIKISNSELFNICKGNKKILLLLLQEGLLTFDEQIVKTVLKEKYCQANYPLYFAPEIKPFIEKDWFSQYDKHKIKTNDFFTKELPEDFYEKRYIGENDSYICKLIRNDSINDFVQYVNQNANTLTSIIKQSIYETNNFLSKYRRLTLIEYAVFFGSIEIFNYLNLNNAKLTSALWIFAIHSGNAQMIHSLEDNGIKPSDKTYRDCLKESIKCHHNDIASYFQNQYVIDDNSSDLLFYCLKYHNLSFEQNDLINKSAFLYLCQYDYFILVNILLNEKDIDINEQKILYKYNLIQFLILMF